jgi:hypothetical protein
MALNNGSPTFHDLIKDVGNRAQKDSNESASAILDLAVKLTAWIVQKRGFHFESLGLQIRDVAADAVAELLSESEQGVPLMRYLREITAETDDPEEIEARLRTILVGTINQNITRILAEFDPSYAKTLRMLRIHVRKSADISVKKAISGHWFYRGSEAESQFHLPALTAEALKSRITIIRSDLNPSVIVMEACLDYLASQTEYRRAVHETDVMKLTVDFLGSELESVTKGHEEAHDDHDYMLLADAVETAITETRQWATKKYVKKQKLSLAELEAMIGAIRMLLLDSADGETESHYYYLRQQMTGLSYDRFRADYRNTFQYILRQIFTKAKGLLVSLGYDRTEEPMESTGD